MSPLPLAAMVFAAGYGTRLRGHALPKPLARAGGAPLIAHVLRRLRSAGVTRCVINVSHQASMIEETLGNGSAHGLAISYSREPRPLEVAGGAALALALLGKQPFIAHNADVASDYNLCGLVGEAQNFGRRLAHLVLGSNPAHHPQGDFTLCGSDAGAPGPGALTYTGMAVFAPELFRAIKPGRPAKLQPLLLRAIAAGRVSAERHTGDWIDAGTPARLARADSIAHLWPAGTPSGSGGS